MLDFSPPMHVARHEQRQAVAGCRAVRGSRVGGERGHLAVRGGAGRTRAARRALRAETVGDSGGGVALRHGPCEEVYVVLLSGPASLP